MLPNMFRRLPKFTKPINKARVEQLLKEDWTLYEKATGASKAEFEIAQWVLPLGVVSSFQHWKPYPLSFQSGKGAYLTDVDGRSYLDLSMGFGATLLGHLHPLLIEETKKALETAILLVTPSPVSREAAERVCRRFQLDLVRFANSGTEATMYAMRTAKAVTGKSGIVKVEGGYHGSCDAATVSAKPAVAEAGPADNPIPVLVPGTTPGEIYVVPFNDIDALERLFQVHAKTIACFIVEPVLENLAIVLPDEGYLERVRELCTKYDVCLIFDEVKTGLTAGPHGAAVRLGVQPDLICLAKSIGGGMPVAAFGGKAEYMQAVIDHRMAHFGTFNANPLVMAGVRATDILATDEALHHAEQLNLGALERISNTIDQYALPAHTVGFGVKGCVTWSINPVRNYRDYKATDFHVAELAWLYFLNRGIVTPPGLDEQWLISLQHEQSEIDLLVRVFQEFAKDLRRV
jgi:glutamate-1-semialdehyde 2,1-aminomutase